MTGRYRPPRTRLAVALVVALLLTTPAALTATQPAAAHPLGNFTVNRFARLEVEAERIRIVYALDMAEVPTFQEMATLDRDRDGAVSEGERAAYLEQTLPRLARGIRLTIDGIDVALTVEPSSGALTLSEGQGGLMVLRLDARFVAALPASMASVREATVRDSNHDARLGWKEIVVHGTADAAVRESSVPATDTSAALRSYPDDLLQSPLDVREARFRFEPGVAGSQSAAARVAERTNRAVSPGMLARFADSAARRDLSAPVIALTLLAALFWGALHALGPGHGKTVVAAYLVGSRGTARHALFLGLTVTATHTAGVYLLGFVTLGASHIIVPERLYPILSLASGLLVVGMGVTLLAGRLRALAGGSARRAGGDPRAHADSDHDHVRAHTAPVGGVAVLEREPRDHQQGMHSDHHHTHEGDHDHGVGHDPHHGHHGHSHVVPGFDGRPVTWRSLLALGVYGGLIPCPTAIVVLLTSISLHRVGYGLALVVAFSAGLAAVLVGIGIALVYAGQAAARVRVSPLIARTVPVVSAAAVVLVGVVLALRAAGVSGLPLI